MSITEKCFLDAFFIPTFRERPADPRRRGFLQVVMDRSLANRTRPGDLSLPQLKFKAEAQDFLDLTHGFCSREQNPWNVPGLVMWRAWWPVPELPQNCQ